MITKNHRQESLCRAYVQAVAAKAGMIWGLIVPDYGTDVVLREVEKRGDAYVETGVQIDVQARSVTGVVASGTSFRYDLDVRTYNVLRAAPVVIPRILVVLALPTNESLWLSQTECEMTVRYCAY